MRSLVLIAIPLLFSCASEEPPPPKPSNILSDDSLAIILAATHKVSAIYQHRGVRRQRLQDYARNEMIELLDSFGVSRDRVDSSLIYYKDDPDHLGQIYDEALNILSTELAEQKASDPKEKGVDSLANKAGSADRTVGKIMNEKERLAPDETKLPPSARKGKKAGKDQKEKLP